MTSRTAAWHWHLAGRTGGERQLLDILRSRAGTGRSLSTKDEMGIPLAPSQYLDEAKQMRTQIFDAPHARHRLAPPHPPGPQEPPSGNAERGLALRHSPTGPSGATLPSQPPPHISTTHTSHTSHTYRCTPLPPSAGHLAGTGEERQLLDNLRRQAGRRSILTSKDERGILLGAPPL